MNEKITTESIKKFVILWNKLYTGINKIVIEMDSKYCTDKINNFFPVLKMYIYKIYYTRYAWNKTKNIGILISIRKFFTVDLTWLAKNL